MVGLGSRTILKAYCVFIVENRSLIAHGFGGDHKSGDAPEAQLQSRVMIG